MKKAKSLLHGKIDFPTMRSEKAHGKEGSIASSPSYFPAMIGQGQSKRGYKDNY